MNYYRRIERIERIERWTHSIHLLIIQLHRHEIQIFFERRKQRNYLLIPFYFGFPSADNRM